MRHGKFQAPRRKTSFALWLVLILAVLSMSFGGVRAYLSFSAGQPVTNGFIADINPTISVDSNYQVTVSNTDYAVYLRAAVVVNWDNSNTDTILAAKSGEYTLTPGTGWIRHGDFYYYKQPVTKDNPTTTPVVSVNGSTKVGYTLAANVAVQAIQALGTTDTGNIPAVTAAWGIPVITEGAQKGELQLP